MTKNVDDIRQSSNVCPRHINLPKNLWKVPISMHSSSILKCDNMLITHDNNDYWCILKHKSFQSYACYHSYEYLSIILQKSHYNLKIL